MASKLYKAVDKKDGVLSVFLVNNRGVTVKRWSRSDVYQIDSSMNNELLYLYDDIDRFNDAVNPVLIAEWLVDGGEKKLIAPCNKDSDAQEHKAMQLDILTAINGAVNINLDDAIELVNTLMDEFDIRHK